MKREGWKWYLMILREWTWQIIVSCQNKFSFIFIWFSVKSPPFYRFFFLLNLFHLQAFLFCSEFLLQSNCWRQKKTTNFTFSSSLRVLVSFSLIFFLFFSWTQEFFFMEEVWMNVSRLFASCRLFVSYFDNCD